MIAKIQLFFETLTLPLSWMPDFCLDVLAKIIFAVSIFILGFFISKVVNIFK